ncbi:MAG: Brevibacillus phage Abouo [Bacillota bacterium]
MASIEKRGPNSYRLVIEIGYDADGKRIKKSKTVKVTTKREAKKALAQFIAEYESGQYIEPEKMTFATFVTKWEEKYAKKHLSPVTLTTYKHQLKNHILPALGHLPLAMIKPMHIVDFINCLEEDGKRKDGEMGRLSSASILHVYRVMRDVFKRAVEWRLIKENIISYVKRPKITDQKQIEVYNEEEVAKLLLALERELPHWRIMITLSITTGMRRGELLALEWKHVDLEHGIIEIKQSLSHIKGKTMIKEPKTKKSTRKVAIPSALIPTIKKYYLQCRLERELYDQWDSKPFFVFSSQNGKTFYYTVPSTWLKRFFKRTGLRAIRFHDLRHTSATLLINQGVHAKIIAERLGHADISTTMNIYGHALQSADQSAADKLNTLLLAIQNKKISS